MDCRRRDAPEVHRTMARYYSESGFSMLMVTDENGQAAAAWDQRAGTERVEAP